MKDHGYHLCFVQESDKRKPLRGLQVRCRIKTPSVKLKRHRPHRLVDDVGLHVLPYLALRTTTKTPFVLFILLCKQACFSTNQHRLRHTTRKITYATLIIALLHHIFSSWAHSGSGQRDTTQPRERPITVR